MDGLASVPRTMETGADERNETPEPPCVAPVSLSPIATLVNFPPVTLGGQTPSSLTTVGKDIDLPVPNMPNMPRSLLADEFGSSAETQRIWAYGENDLESAKSRLSDPRKVWAYACGDDMDSERRLLESQRIWGYSDESLRSVKKQPSGIWAYGAEDMQDAKVKVPEPRVSYENESVKKSKKDVVCKALSDVMLNPVFKNLSKLAEVQSRIAAKSKEEAEDVYRMKFGRAYRPSCLDHIDILLPTYASSPLLVTPSGQERDMIGALFSDNTPQYEALYARAYEGGGYGYPQGRYAYSPYHVEMDNRSYDYHESPRTGSPKGAYGQFPYGMPHPMSYPHRMYYPKAPFMNRPIPAVEQRRIYEEQRKSYMRYWEWVRRQEALHNMYRPSLSQFKQYE
eukprot:Platyproteum_vivax@DN3328_c0_g1_i1.p1